MSDTSRRPMATAADGSELTLPQLTDSPRRVLSRLAAAGHEAALVGGSLRDVLRGEQPSDWDVATAARPEVVAALFPGSTWQNRFGTVTVRDAQTVEVTTYRTESGYRDRRRPDEVLFGRSLREDLARRDFTINAMAWLPLELEAGRGRLLDPFGGIGDLRRGLLRAVGDPHRRFDEDALRLLRGVRFAARFGLELDASTAAAMRRLASTAAGVSGERVRDELRRILSGHRAPSDAFDLMERLGLLAVLLPELAALRGVPQAKPLAGDALDHSLRTADELPGNDVGLRVAGLLHDLGKATTLADGHFYGHEQVGADMAGAVLRRLRFPVGEVDRIVHLVRLHMFAYTPDWTDGAVRRFIRRVGVRHLDALFALRRADNAASGVAEPEEGGLGELEARIERELHAPMQASDLAIDGHDLQRELGLTPGPVIGRLLDVALEAVVEDPSRNERETLLALAREALEDGAGTHREADRNV